MARSSWKKLFLPFLIPLNLGAVTPTVVVSSAIAQTEVPMRLQHAEGEYTITVPDSIEYY